MLHENFLYYKTKKSASLRYFDTWFMHNIGIVSDTRWHDSLFMCYINKASCHRLSETLPILCCAWNMCQNNRIRRTFCSYSIWLCEWIIHVTNKHQCFHTFQINTLSLGCVSTCVKHNRLFMWALIIIIITILDERLRPIWYVRLLIR